MNNPLPDGGGGGSSTHRPGSPDITEYELQRLKTCAESSDLNVVFRSDNYPLHYDANTDCLYKLKRHNPSICRAEIIFSDFSVGTSEPATRSGSERCINDFLKIDGVRYCGYKRGEVITLAFPIDSDEILMRFRTDTSNEFGGFRIDIRQISERCINGGSISGISGSIGGGAGPGGANGIITSNINSYCNNNSTYKQSNFQLVSPTFQIGSYPDNMYCKYTILKASYDICALEIQYNLFDLQESQDCIKDYLQIGQLKVCGKLPLDAKRK